MAFQLFGKHKKETGGPVFIDRTYISTTAKMNACLNLARQEPDTVFLSWFSETAKNGKAFFRIHEVDESKIMETRYVHMALLQHKKTVFIEHHPLQAKEVEFVRLWPYQEIIVMNALDEPIFKHFGGENIILLMQRLGMKEDEVIENEMVSKAIANAQKKIASLITIEQSCTSQAEWMNKNIK